MIGRPGTARRLTYRKTHREQTNLYQRRYNDRRRAKRIAARFCEASQMAAASPLTPKAAASPAARFIEACEAAANLELLKTPIIE
jgi:hypothetical protein